MLATCAVHAGAIRAAAADGLVQPRGSVTSPAAMQPMDEQQPMQSGMKRPGMKMGDVKKAAEAKQKEMEKQLEMEEKSMPAAPAEQTPAEKSPAKQPKM